MTRRYDSGTRWERDIRYSWAAVRPAATLLIVAGLIEPALLVEIEVDAYVLDRGSCRTP